MMNGGVGLSTGKQLLLPTTASIFPGHLSLTFKTKAKANPKLSSLSFSPSSNRASLRARCYDGPIRIRSVPVYRDSEWVEKRLDGIEKKVERVMSLVEQKDEVKEKGVATLDSTLLLLIDRLISLLCLKLDNKDGQVIALDSKLDTLISLLQPKSKEEKKDKEKEKEKENEEDRRNFAIQTLRRHSIPTLSDMLRKNRNIQKYE